MRSPVNPIRGPRRGANPLPLAVRRAVLGILATLAILITIGRGLTDQSNALAWLTAAGIAGLVFLAVRRFGNAPALFVRPGWALGPRAMITIVAGLGLAGISLLQKALPANWQITFWAAIAATLLAFTITPPERPLDDD